jgi:uncharacterized protein
MRWVPDTNVILSALFWGGKPYALLQAGVEGRATLYTSDPIIAELRSVLARSKFARHITTSGTSIETLVSQYCLLTQFVVPIPLTGIAPDPDDDIIIATAIAAQADAVITGDKPLLSLGVYQGVRMMTVSDALTALG